MLHDPTRDVPFLLTVQPLKDWLDTQPPEKRYDYGLSCECALAQYLKSKGFARVEVGCLSVTVNGKAFALPEELDDIVREGDRSFGEAAKRAENALI